MTFLTTLDDGSVAADAADDDDDDVSFLATLSDFDVRFFADVEWCNFFFWTVG